MTTESKESQLKTITAALRAIHENKGIKEETK